VQTAARAPFVSFLQVFVPQGSEGGDKGSWNAKLSEVHEDVWVTDGNNILLIEILL